MSKRCCAQWCYNSQLNNRNIGYFGFPKSEIFARKWAIAAGRDDLLTKPIQSVVKYYLCSSHFTDDCFCDPPTNTILKKSSRPTVVPIPTVFKSNIELYNPQSGSDGSGACGSHGETTPPQRTVNVEQQSKTEHKTSPKYGSSKKRRRVSNPSAKKRNSGGVEPQPINNNEIVPQSENLMTLNDESIFEDDIKNEIDNEIFMEGHKDMNEYILPSNTSQEFVSDHSDFDLSMDNGICTCRLCANNYELDNLVLLSEDEDLRMTINNLIPKTIIDPSDGMPQQVCIFCIERVNQCVGILKSFELAQEKLLTPLNND